MDDSVDNEINKRLDKIMGNFMLQIVEQEYLEKNGHSLRAEKFANHLITDSSDGVGIFIFEDNTPWQMWRYTKMMGMVAFKHKPIELYRTLDDIMNSNEEHSVTLMTIPFDEDGKVDMTAKEVILYAIHGTNIKPFTDEQNEKLIASLGGITVKNAQPWTYDAYAEYDRLVI